MAISSTIRTYFNGSWHEGDVAIMKAADHASWLGSSVFDGARLFDGVTPDLDLHCARANASARALMMEPTVNTQDMVDIAKEGLAQFGAVPLSTSARCTGQPMGMPPRLPPTPNLPDLLCASKKSRWRPPQRPRH